MWIVVPITDVQLWRISGKICVFIAEIIAEGFLFFLDESSVWSPGRWCRGGYIYMIKFIIVMEKTCIQICKFTARKPCFVMFSKKIKQNIHSVQDSLKHCLSLTANQAQLGWSLFDLWMWNLPRMIRNWVIQFNQLNTKYNIPSNTLWPIFYIFIKVWHY